MQPVHKIRALRSYLDQQNLDGFLVPRADAWPGEFVREYAERLKWLSGFSGSSGAGIVLRERAVVLTDGRYSIQVVQQVDPGIWSTGDITETSALEWLNAEMKAGEGRIGYDPWLHTPDFLKQAQEKLADNIELVPLTSNPIDNIWTESRPANPNTKVYSFPDHIAGQSSKDKRMQIAGQLQDKGAATAILAMPDSIAWLLNIRADDIPMTPVALSYAIINDQGQVQWFIDPARVPEEVRDKLAADVVLYSPEDIEPCLNSISAPVLMDKSATPLWFQNRLEDKNIIWGDDPCMMPKAVKTEAEREAVRQAHIVDGLALTKFHDWIKANLPQDGFDELDLEQKLTELRAEHPAYQGNSFSPICGFKGHGAIIHYRATTETARQIDGQGLLLVDSGGQYFGEDIAGTTDITRTYAIGSPTEEQRRAYTLVLKAHIAVSRAQFPYGATGAQIDALARAQLWEEGYDYPHGTGHGVGCFLNVHEAASNLSPRESKKLEPGMLLSNEPGLYVENEYGIRIENLLFVQKTGTQDHLGRELLCFETVTYVPYDETLIDKSILSQKEIDWLDSYNQIIFEEYNYLLRKP